MKKVSVVILGLVMMAGLCSAQKTKQGKWLNITDDSLNSHFLFSDGGKLLLTEDYEVLKTHEVCASLNGYFLSKSELGRFQVRFNGMRTSSTFVFTTQYDAEKWVEKWCTPESLTHITAGRGNMGRSY